MSLSVMILCNSKRFPMLQRTLYSLEQLAPDEVCILNTDWKPDSQPIWDMAYGLKLNVAERPWDNFRDSRNALVQMCSSDWMLILDSDEIISREMAVGTKELLASLPEHILSIRVGIVDLIDEKTCLAHTVFKSRWPIHYHGSFFRKGCVHYEGPLVHEVPEYPGKRTVPFDSPEHPLYDWLNHYIVHLWLYKDFPFMRWPGDLQLYKDRIGKEPWVNIYEANTQRIVDDRKWQKVPLIDIHYDMFPWVYMEADWARELVKLGEIKELPTYFGKNEVTIHVV